MQAAELKALVDGLELLDGDEVEVVARRVVEDGIDAERSAKYSGDERFSKACEGCVLVAVQCDAAGGDKCEHIVAVNEEAKTGTVLLKTCSVSWCDISCTAFVEYNFSDDPTWRLSKVSERWGNGMRCVCVCGASVEGGGEVGREVRGEGERRGRMERECEITWW